MLFAVLVLAVAPAPAGARAPDAIQVIRDQPYGRDQGQELLLDVYRPADRTSPLPIVLLIHGGGWIAGDKDNYEPFARSLARDGFVVFDINYSLDLSQSPGFPRQVDDVHTALAWVQEHATAFSGDTGRIAVAGGSAGGYLAAMLGTQANTNKTRPVRAVVSLSAPMDLVALAADLRLAAASAPGPCAPMSCDAVAEAAQSLRNLLGCDALQCPEELLREASPITYVTSASPSFFLANSTEEIVPATQASGMADALRAHGVPVDLELVPGRGHSIAYVSNISSSLLGFLTDTGASSPPAAGTTAPNPSLDGQGRGGRLRWLVVAAVLGLLAAIILVRRRSLGGSATVQGDLLEHSPADQDRR
jgi:acetyl esterase/lipase